MLIPKLLSEGLRHGVDFTTACRYLEISLQIEQLNYKRDTYMTTRISLLGVGQLNKSHSGGEDKQRQPLRSDVRDMKNCLTRVTIFDFYDFGSPDSDEIPVLYQEVAVLVVHILDRHSQILTQ